MKRTGLVASFVSWTSFLFGLARGLSEALIARGHGPIKLYGTYIPVLHIPGPINFVNEGGAIAYLNNQLAT